MTRPKTSSTETTSAGADSPAASGCFNKVLCVTQTPVVVGSKPPKEQQKTRFQAPVC
jgi:hypothetical protein